MRHGARRYALFALAILFGTTLVVYTGIKARPLLAGPSVAIASPLPGTVAARSTLPVIGMATNVSRLTLDGRQIFVDARGIFSEVVLLPEGYTVLEVAGEDRFGRVVRARAEVVRRSAY